MRHIPVVYVTIHFGGVITPAGAAGESWIVRLDPISLGILGPDVSFFLSEHVFVVLCPFQKEAVILRPAKRARQLRRAPIVVTLIHCYRNGLASLGFIHQGNRLLFAGMQRRKITVFIIKIIERTI